MSFFREQISERAPLLKSAQLGRRADHANNKPLTRLVSLCLYRHLERFHAKKVINRSPGLMFSHVETLQSTSDPTSAVTKRSFNAT